MYCLSICLLELAMHNLHWRKVFLYSRICVTTPQQVALDDTERSLDMFQKLHIPTVGIMENMSGFICPETNKEYPIFGKKPQNHWLKNLNDRHW